jgi:hypothetical protein
MIFKSEHDSFIATATVTAAMATPLPQVNVFGIVVAVVIMV